VSIGGFATNVYSFL